MTFVCGFVPLFTQWYIVYRGHGSFGVHIYRFYIMIRGLLDFV